LLDKPLNNQADRLTLLQVQIADLVVPDLSRFVLAKVLRRILLAATLLYWLAEVYTKAEVSTLAQAAD